MTDPQDNTVADQELKELDEIQKSLKVISDLDRKYNEEITKKLESQTDEENLLDELKDI